MTDAIRNEIDKFLAALALGFPKEVAELDLRVASGSSPEPLKERQRDRRDP
jgi:hypothetical protein